MVIRHNRAIRVRAAALPTIKPMASLQRRLTPVPVKSALVKNVVPVAARPKQRIVVQSSKKKPLSYRSTRQIPPTKIRLMPRPNAELSRAVGTQENCDSINRLRSLGVGRTLVIVGNGPSHKEAPLTKLMSCDLVDIMSINKPDDRLWPTKYWLFCDSSQYKRHQALWAGYGGTIINSVAIRNIKKNTVRVKTIHGKGFSTNLLKGMYVGRSSCYAALQVGIWMGYDHIYVFGVDMTSVGGKVYAWGTNPDVSDSNRIKRFKYEAESYDWLVGNVSPDIKSKITFCSRYNPFPFVDKFEKLDHMDAVDTIISRVNAKNVATPALETR